MTRITDGWCGSLSMSFWLLAGTGIALTTLLDEVEQRALVVDQDSLGSAQELTTELLRNLQRLYWQ